MSRALLPDVVKFAYTPKDEIRINATQQSNGRASSPDFGKFMQSGPSSHDTNSDEHILVLDFLDNVRGNKGDSYM